MGLREQSIAGCFTQSVFQFFVVQVLVGLRKEFINHIVFSTSSCAAGFNNNNNNNDNNWAVQNTYFLLNTCGRILFSARRIIFYIDDLEKIFGEYFMTNECRNPRIASV